MYERVKTRYQQKKFEEIWEYFCTKYDWLNDPYAKNGQRYNLITHQGFIYKRKKAIGTIEFIPYDPTSKNSTVEGPDRFEFSKYNEIRLNQDHIWEIDKLCIHQDYQRQGYFRTFMHILYHHATENQTKYYLSLMEHRLYRMLKFMLGAFIEQKGEPLVGPTTSLIPTVIHVEKILEDKEKTRKLLEGIN